MGSSLFPILTYVNSKGYAVVDFETTGLNPARGDRAIEIGLVHVAPDGTLEDEHETLIRVHRDIGAQWIHHISAVELIHAPEFEGIARELRDLLAGRVFVAHNVAFDSKFLLSEYRRLGADIPVNSHTMLCTMKLSRSLIGVGSLADCCREFGIDNEDAHSALSDAHATALLLDRLMDADPEWSGWRRRLDAAEEAGEHWPELTSFERREWLPRRSHVENNLQCMIGGASAIGADDATGFNPPLPKDFRLHVGDKIVLAGSMRQRRSDWEAELESMGLEVRPSVTKQVRLVVAADPYSESTKARKARDYGIPIVAEHWLEQAMVNGIDY